MAYALNSRRVMAFFLISTMLVSCTADGLVPPAPVDRGTRVSAIPPGRIPVQQAPSVEAYAAPAQPMTQSQAGYGNGNVSQPMPPVTSQGHGQGQGRLPMIDSEEAMAAPRQMGEPPKTLGTLTYNSDGVNMDAALGVGGAEQGAPAVVGLAEEQNNDIAEGNASQPVVDGIGTDAPVQRNRPPQQQRLAQPYAASVPVPPAQNPYPPAQTPPAQKRNAQPARGDLSGAPPRWSDSRPVVAPSRMEPEPQQVAMLMPRNPTAAPQSSRTDVSPMPASEASCRAQLRRLGVLYRDKPQISDGPSCGIDYPVELYGLSGDIQVKPAVTLNCQTTLAFAQWVKNELVPSSRVRYWSGIGKIEPMGGYSCRRMNNSRQRYNPMSEHARGNAIDVGRFVLKNGHEIDVRKKGLFSFREGALLKAVRDDSCKYFNTVLGPGSNAEHWNHFHFDLRSRASGNRYCD